MMVAAVAAAEEEELLPAAAVDRIVRVDCIVRVVSFVFLQAHQSLLVAATSLNVYYQDSQ